MIIAFEGDCWLCDGYISVLFDCNGLPKQWTCNKGCLVCEEISDACKEALRHAV